METNLKLTRFYLDHTDTLDSYQKNITQIYTQVEDILNDFFNVQIEEKINTIYRSIDQYKEPYYNKIKPATCRKN